VKTAEFIVAKKLSETGTTVPRYFFTRSGCSRIASEIGMKITPAFWSSFLKVVATDTESNTASTATREEPLEPGGISEFSSNSDGSTVFTTPARISCSRSGIPSFS